MIQEGPFLKIINKIKENTPKFNERTKEALLWYKKKVQQLIREPKDPQKIYEQNSKKPVNIPGQILTFVYNPKGKRELPYFDKYPLCLVIRLIKGGFIGLNFHYISPIDRAIFMDSLYKYYGERKGQDVIKIDYRILVKNATKFRFYKACIKRYRYDHMSSTISIITPDLWDIALFVPTEKFLSLTGNKTSKELIYEDSKKIYKR